MLYFLTIIVGAYSDNPSKEEDIFKTYDQKSSFCLKSLGTTPCDILNFDSNPKCCCDYTACDYGSIRSILQVMKESLYHPHLLDLDSRMTSFNGNVLESFISKPPLYITEELMGFKLIGPDSFKDQTYSQRHFFTPEPFIPFCKINDDWANLPYYGAEIDNSTQIKYCTFCRPKLSDYGICYTMNSFTKVMQSVRNTIILYSFT